MFINLKARIKSYNTTTRHHVKRNVLHIITTLLYQPFTKHYLGFQGCFFYTGDNRNHWGKKEKLLNESNSSFSHNVFYSTKVISTNSLFIFFTAFINTQDIFVGKGDSIIISMLQKEKLLNMSNLAFSHNDFYITRKII